MWKFNLGEEEMLEGEEEEVEGAVLLLLLIVISLALMNLLNLVMMNWALVHMMLLNPQMLLYR